MIITRLAGGLGNQLFQYALGRSIAERYSLELKLDINSFAKDRLRSFELDNFKMELNYATQNEISRLKGGESIYHKSLRKVYNKNFGRAYTYCAEIEFGSFQDINCKTGGLYLDGYWQNELYFNEIRKILIDELQPVSVSDEAKRFIENPVSFHKVGVHVRRGDYISSEKSNTKHGFSGLDYYIKAIEYVRKEINSPLFFIVSDDIEWCKHNLSFDDCVFIDSTTNHYDDFVILKSCDIQIISNSTFSWWAAWLNHSINKIVISPNKWFNDNNSVNIAAASWIRL